MNTQKQEQTSQNSEFQGWFQSWSNIKICSTMALPTWNLPVGSIVGFFDIYKKLKLFPCYLHFTNTKSMPQKIIKVSPFRLEESNVFSNLPIWSDGSKTTCSAVLPVNKTRPFGFVSVPVLKNPMFPSQSCKLCNLPNWCFLNMSLVLRDILLFDRPDLRDTHTPLMFRECVHCALKEAWDINDMNFGNLHADVW